MAELSSDLAWLHLEAPMGPSEPTYVHIAKSMTCSHEGLFFLVPVGMKDDVATVPNWIARCEAVSWRNCHLIWPGSTWKLLGSSEPTYIHTAKSMTCSHDTLFFLVPVGLKDDVATVPNWIARCEAASWPNCHLIWPASTCQLLGPSEPTYVHMTKGMTCSHQSQSSLVPVGLKDDVALDCTL